MSANYSRVYHRIWSNKQFRNATRDARDAALYLLTCPHRNTEGLFRLPIPFAMFDLQWDEPTTLKAFAELETIGFIDRDDDNDLVMIVNALKWQTPAGKDRIKGAVNALAELPETPLMKRFMVIAEDVCPPLADQLRLELGWTVETLSTPSPDPLDTVSRQSQDSPEYSSSSSSSSSPSSSNSTTTSSLTSDPVENGGGKLNTIAEARDACHAKGWTQPEIDQRIEGIDDDPTVERPDAVRLTRLRAMATETPPGTHDHCGPCTASGWVITDDGAERCPNCHGTGRTPRTERVDQETW